MSTLFYMGIVRKPSAKDVLMNRRLAVDIDDGVAVLMRHAELEALAHGYSDIGIFKPPSSITTLQSLEQHLESQPLLTSFMDEVDYMATFREVFDLGDDALTLPSTFLIVLFEFPVPVAGRVNIEPQLIKKWNVPLSTFLSPADLQVYLNAPLDPQEKILISSREWDELLRPNPSLPDDYCSEEVLDTLFTRTETNITVLIEACVYVAIISSPPQPMQVTERAFLSFWDGNLVNILINCLGTREWIRGEDRDSRTDSFRPGLGLFLQSACVLHGEEKINPIFGKHPRHALIEKTRWVYDPAPYIIGYYVVGTEVTIVAIQKNPDQSMQPPLLSYVTSSDLSTRQGRVRNAVKIIRLVKVLRLLGQTVTKGVDVDMWPLAREGGGSINFLKTKVRKGYRAENAKVVSFLAKLYGILAEKQVPNVDRLVEFEESESNPYVELEPRGFSDGPKSAYDVKNAVRSVLEALIALHALEPAILHRDICWFHVMQSTTNSTKWFLIDFEEAAFAPAVAVTNLNPETHSPQVLLDGHGPEVDIWAVGRLIITMSCLGISKDFISLGNRMIAGSIVTAEQALAEVQLL
ncbi:hypothetical protein DL96DRAFT_1594926 [Flagelloscypha sp. PMI_526]|nr:hypothetical protein DL96DRAFT_1594926 [Flagelloscypha sp. PMI_526]